ncbi:hypothetical protein R6Q59_023896 [Mikania micrantha]
MPSAKTDLGSLGGVLTMRSSCIVLKRYNGKLEYFKKPQDFCSLPPIDLRNLNKVTFMNFDKVNKANQFVKFLKDQYHIDFTIMKLAKWRRFKHKYYPPPRIKKSVPIHTRVPDDTLKDFKFWYFDEDTFGVVIVRESGDIFILDPMDLLKFGRIDMIVLFQNPIKVVDGFDQEAKPFFQGVGACYYKQLVSRWYFYQLWYLQVDMLIRKEHASGFWVLQRLK